MFWLYLQLIYTQTTNCKTTFLFVMRWACERLHRKNSFGSFLLGKFSLHFVSLNGPKISFSLLVCCCAITVSDATLSSRRKQKFSEFKNLFRTINIKIKSFSSGSKTFELQNFRKRKRNSSYCHSSMCFPFFLRYLGSMDEFQLWLFPINSIVEKIYFLLFMIIFLEVFTVLFRGFSPFFFLISSGSFFFLHLLNCI